MPKEIEWWLNPDPALRDARQAYVVEKEKEENGFHVGLGFEITLQQKKCWCQTNLWIYILCNKQPIKRALKNKFCLFTFRLLVLIEAKRNLWGYQSVNAQVILLSPWGQRGPVERVLAWQVGTKTTSGYLISLISVSLSAGEDLILKVCFSSRIFK